MVRSPATTIGSGAGTKSNTIVGTQTGSPTTTTVAGGGVPFVVKTTVPAQLIRHNIADEELEMLGQQNRDGLSEALWAFTAGALAALPSAVGTLYNAYLAEERVPISILHLVEIFIVVVCAALAVCIHIISGRRGRKASKLIEQIRARAPQ